MKTICSFFTKKIAETGRYTVFFSKQKSRNDIREYEVDLQIPTKNPKLIAELAVIRHVLLESNLLNNPSAKNIIIQCSQGAIKKLLRNSSQKIDGYNFIRFLKTRLPGMDISVKHDKSLAVEKATKETLIIDEKPQETELTSIGPIKLTEHAISRFHERFHPQKTVDSAARILINTLRSGNLREIKINKKSHTRSVVKHKCDANYWTNGDVRFVVVPEGCYQTLVTVTRQQAGAVQFDSGTAIQHLY